MELEFCKHFKDATNLLLMMDHDSGYVEGVESYPSSSNGSDSLRGTVDMNGFKEPDNFLLSEDALLEKPEIFFDWGNLADEINNEDYEETRRLFFSPEVISSSLKSSDSSIVYSGLENELSSGLSDEIPMQSPIVVKTQESSIIIHKQIQELDVSTTSISDMSLETSTFDPLIIEKENGLDANLTNPLKGFSMMLSHSHIKESAINSLERKEKSLVNNGIGCSSIPDLEFSVSAETNEIKDYKKNFNKTSIIVTTNSSSLAPGIKIVEDTSKTPEKLSPSNAYLDNGKTLQVSDTQPGCSSQIPESTHDVWEVRTANKSVTPSKSNPLTTVTNNFEISKERRRLTLVFSMSEKENGYCVKRKYPSITPEKSYKSPVNSDVSPELFGDEKSRCFIIQAQDTVLPSMAQSQKEEKYINKLDKKLLKQIHKGLSGVLPPPSVTVIHMTVVEMLSKLDENKKYFWNNDTAIEECGKEESKDTSLNSSSESNNSIKSLLLNVDLEKAKNVNKFPEVLNMRYHGLHYNCSKTSEEIVDLCEKYQKRFVGAETQSTCTVFETQNLTSPTKRKVPKPRWGGGKSPGRRLSHLARRRITFSSANLQAGASSIAGSRARQILVDAKKMELLNRRKSPRKTPKKTPSKSPKVKTRTPSSSAKKKLAMRFRKLTGEFEKSVPSTSEMSSVQRALFRSPNKSSKSECSEGISKSTKRALFQSPNRDTNSSLFTTKSQDFSSSAEKSQLRRALFISPKKMSPLKGKKSPFKRSLQFGYEKKRKRSESNDVRPSKFSRSMSMDFRSSTSGMNKSFTRAQSELNISLNRSQSQMELTDQHKKKLQWAVYSALQTQNITSSHPQWKVWASVLGRVTCRFFTSQMTHKGAAGAKLEGGTTERMNRIARRHVISVIKGKSVDEIINEYINSRPQVHKPQGYVAPEGFNNFKNTTSSDIKDNVFQDRVNIIESWEKKKLEQMSKPPVDNKIERIRKVINFGEDR